MKIETIAVHAGNHPDKQLGAVSPPIYQTATFTAADTDDIMAINRGDKQGFVYSRLRNPTVMALEEKLARLEGAEIGNCLRLRYGCDCSRGRSISEVRR